MNESTNGRGTANIEKLNRRYFAKFCHFLQLGIRDMLNFHVEKQAVNLETGKNLEQRPCSHGVSCWSFSEQICCLLGQ